MPDLKQMMIDAQKNDVKLQQMVQLVKNGDNQLFYKIYGGLYYKNRLCVPSVQEMKKKLMYEATILYSPCILEVTRCTKI